MRTALRTLEGLLLDGSRRTARRNAWQSVLEDRSRARARAEAEQLLTAAARRPARQPTAADSRAMSPVPPAGTTAARQAT